MSVPGSDHQIIFFSPPFFSGLWQILIVYDVYDEAEQFAAIDTAVSKCN